MHDTSNRVEPIHLIFGVTVVLFALTLIGHTTRTRESTNRNPITAQQQPAAEPTGFVHPIYSSAEAISRTIESFAHGTSAYDWHAVQLTEYSLEADWYQDGINSGSQSVAVWLVGARTTDMTAELILGVSDAFRDLTGGESTPTAAEGVYYVWEAGSGARIGDGALIQSSSLNYSRLTSLQEDVVAIRTATELPAEEEFMATLAANKTATSVTSP